MELIKDLPEVFEEFAEQRKNSFLGVKKLKEQGVPIVGAYCTYFPQEIAMAMGAATVGLCSTSDETIPDAERDLPKNLCPLIKSSYGFAKTEKCPFFYFSDVVVGETTCDGKKKMYEYMSRFKDVFIMELPNTQRPEALQLWKGEIIRFKEYLEEKFDVTITEEDIREAIRVNNAGRRSLKQLYEVMLNDPVPITGHDLFKVLYGSTFKFDRKAIPAEVDALVEKIKKEYAEGKMLEKKPRILITGCPVGGATEKVIDAVENNGGVVVTFENCSISGTQPFCYCKGLRLINCGMTDTDLAFERSDAEAYITTPVISIKNPYSGVISVPSAGEIVIDDENAKAKIIIRDNTFENSDAAG